MKNAKHLAALRGRIHYYHIEQGFAFIMLATPPMRSSRDRARRHATASYNNTARPAHACVYDRAARMPVGVSTHSHVQAVPSLAHVTRRLCLPPIALAQQRTTTICDTILLYIYVVINSAIITTHARHARAADTVAAAIGVFHAMPGSSPVGPRPVSRAQAAYGRQRTG
jgi:hypothetical protein